MIEKFKGVLMDPNPSELEVLEILLGIAERHLDEFPKIKWSNSDRYMSQEGSRSLGQGMIDYLRKMFDIETE